MPTILAGHVRRRSLTSASSSQDEEANSCGVKVYEDGCSEQRSCRSCVSASLRDQALSCYLEASSGQCSSFTELGLTQDTLAEFNEAANTSASAQTLENSGIYSSENREYCSLSDSACTLCKTLGDYPSFRLTEGQLKTVSADRSICYGTSGCICAAACESSKWLEQAGPRCSSDSPSPFNSNSSSLTSNIMMGFGAVVLLQIVIGAVFLVRRRRRRQGLCGSTGPFGNAEGQHHAQHLQLQGWLAWQKKMCDDERNNDSAFINLDVLPQLPRAIPEVQAMPSQQAPQ